MSDFEKDEELDDELEILTLVNNEGEEIDFEVLASVEIEGEIYLAIQTAIPPENEEDDGVYVLQVCEDDEGNEKYIFVEDDDIINAVVDEVNELYADDASEE